MYLTNEEKFTLISVSMLAFLALFFVTDIFGAIKRPVKAVVLEKHYQPSSSSVGVGNGFGSNGKTFTTVDYNYEDEKFTLIVEFGECIESVRVDAVTYYKTNQKDTISLKTTEGVLTGKYYGLTK